MSKAKIFYFTLRDEQRKQEKLDWFRNTRFQDIPFERITPDEHGNWINLADTDFKTLLPLANKQTKLAKTNAQENAVFKLFSLGVSTNRDEWVYDYDKKTLEAKIKYFAKVFNQESKRFRGKDVTKIGNELSNAIKSSSSLKANLVSGKEFQFEKDRLVKALYRPFFKQFFYAEQIINDRLTVNHIQMFGEKFDKENKMIGVMGDATEKPFSTLASSIISDMNFLSPAAAGTKFFPLYRYTESGERVENITDWALEQFRAHYGERKIQKKDIFHYVYAVLHNPAYLKKYELDLKREFPRVPFYDDFWQWAAWGKRLMDLHLNYESAKPFGLKPIDLPDEKVPKELKVRLKANKEKGIIEIDEQTTLSGVPKEAWEYKLGNRSALEWILDQYKESKPKDKTIAEKFHTYRFADYKEEVIDLLKRVCTVSVETVKIMREMERDKES
jgi:predicted helicase